MSDVPNPSDSEEGVELLQAWLVGEHLECSILADAFEDPGTWGTILAELARHIVTASREQGEDANAVREAIRQAFLDGLDSAESSS